MTTGKPIAGTEAAKTEPVMTTEPVQTDPNVAKMMEKMEAMEKRLEDRELALIEKEKELDKKIEATRFLKPMSEERRQEVEEIHQSKSEIMKRQLEKQPKVRMFVPLQGMEKAGTVHPVVMNGYRLNVPKGVYVDLPQQVADLLKNSFQQTEAAGAAFRLDLSNKEKQEALAG
jgi:hypothetical protein